MSRLPGYKSIAEFARRWGLAPDTARNQLRRGYCMWPRRQQLGQSNHPLYTTWRGIKARCLNKNSKDYPRYGGRDIKICPTWAHSFDQFLRDMGEKPDESYSIDRIDNGLGYFKENCRWASGSEQAVNQRKRKTNTSGVVGVHYHRHRGVWAFQRKRNGKIFRKYFKTKEEAIKFKEQFDDNTLTDS